MKKRSIIRIASIVTVAMMLVGIIPTGALADEELPQEEVRAEAVVSEAVELRVAVSEDTEVPAQKIEEAPAAPEAPAAEAKDAPEANTEAPAAPDAPAAPAAEIKAAPETAPEKPEMPDVTNLDAEQANALISAYNEQVDRYNEQVDAYNSAYQAYENSVGAYNAEVEGYNADAAAYNELLKKYGEEVEEYNRVADELNADAAAYNAEAEAHNAEEEKKVAASDAAMEKYNANMVIYNKNVATIERKDREHTALIETQKEQLGDIYRCETAEDLASLGEVLEEDLVRTYGKRTVTIAKAGDLVIKWDDLNANTDRNTIKITAGEESDSTYKIANLHVFLNFEDMMEMSNYQIQHGWDCFNINVDDQLGIIVIPAAVLDTMALVECEVAEAGNNDTVAVGSQNMVFDNDNGTLTTSRYLEGYTKGYYWLNDAMLLENADIIDSYGTTHVMNNISANTLNINKYSFYKYTNRMPSKPTEYSANYMELKSMIDKIEANAEEMSPLSYAELTGGMIARLSRMNLLTVPAPEQPKEEKKPEPKKPVQKKGSTKKVTEEPAAEIVEEEVPLAGGKLFEQKYAEAAPVVPAVLEIVEEDVPLAVIEEPEAQARPVWALVNLLCAIGAVLTAAAAILTGNRKDDGAEKANESGNGTGMKVLSGILAAASVVLFLLTEDMTAKMALTDSWTIAMAALFAGTAGAAVLKNAKKKEAEAE